MDQEFVFNCSILGPDVERSFAVEILPSKSISQLKKVIKKEMKPKLDHIAAGELDVYKVSDSAQYTHRH